MNSWHPVKLATCIGHPSDVDLHTYLHHNLIPLVQHGRVIAVNPNELFLIKEA
jgi:hypothetical protein